MSSVMKKEKEDKYRSKRIKKWLGKYKWLLIGLLWVIVIALGCVGFSKHFTNIGEIRSFWEVLYASLQLIVLESGLITISGSLELEAARFLAPLLAVYTVIQAVASIFREQIQLLRMRSFKNHIIICGLGRKGSLLCQAFRKRGEKVVAIEQDNCNDFLEQCRQQGAIVLVGNATDSVILHQTRVDRAKYVISVCGNDGLVFLPVQAGQGDRECSGRLSQYPIEGLPGNCACVPPG